MVLDTLERFENMIRTGIIVSLLLCSLFVIGQNTDAINKDSLQQQKKAEKQLRENSLYLDGVKLSLTNDREKAIQQFEILLSEFPENAPGKFELSKLYAASNNFPRGIELMNQAIKIDPANIWYKILLCDLYEASGDPKKLIELLEIVIKKEPLKQEFYERLVNAYLSDNKPEEAVKTLDLMAKEFGNTEELGLKKYNIYLQAGNTKEAAEELESVISKNPEKAQNYYLLAEMFYKENKTDKATEVLSRLEKVLPNDEYVCFTLAEYYRKANKQDLFIEAFERGIQNKFVSADTKVQYLLAFYPVNDINETNKDNITRLTNSLAQMYPENNKVLLLNADISYFFKDFVQADKDYQKLILADSSMYYPWERLLVCKSQLNDSIGLADAAQRAADLFPYQPFPLFFQGLEKLQKKEYAEAIKILENGEKLLTDESIEAIQFYSSLGDAWNALQNHEKSDYYYEKALAIDSLNNYVLNNFSYYLALRGEKLAKALRMSAKTVKSEPYNATYLDTYGWVLYKSERLKEAKDILEKAVLLNKTPDGTVYEHFGDVLFKLGSIEEAIKNWELAKQFGGYSKLLDKKLDDKKLYE